MLCLGMAKVSILPTTFVILPAKNLGLGKERKACGQRAPILLKRDFNLAEDVPLPACMWLAEFVTDLDSQEFPIRL